MTPPRVHPLNLLTTEGFRLFFLAAGVMAVLAMLVWVIWLAAHAWGGVMIDLPFSMAPHHWHGHEMIFGYGAAAMAGFFLTAVPNWTGLPGAQRGFLIAAGLVWLAGRAAMTLSGTVSPVWVAVLNLAFLPFLAAKVASLLLRRPKPQNLLFLGVIAAIWLADLRVHLDWLGLPWGDAGAGLRAGLIGLCAMIAVLGGRITPAFTRNALLRAGIESPAHLPINRAALDRAGNLTALALPLAVLAGLPEAATGGLALLAGGLALLRLVGWRGWALRRDALVVVLHLGYGLLAVGLIAWGLAGLGLGSEVAALHLLGVGAIGTMTLAVMSRAALGHTGRGLRAPALMPLAYGLVIAAALLRWIGSAAPGLYYPAVIGAGLAWILGFALFVVIYAPILTAPRLPRQG
ncbi:NnrS family protein [Paracoccus sp. p3-h83]|uniref:NnrS family protein n=1 Tax=Paracoccus sp. p3-h83 TaxID=3342805 RepID=UPI0035B6F402